MKFIVSIDEALVVLIYENINFCNPSGMKQ